MCKKIIFLHLFIFISGISALFAQVPSETKSSEIKELSACEGRVNLICENASGTLFAASDSACVNIYDERDWSLVCRFYDEGVARISFFTEGDSEFFITMTKDGQYIVRKLNLYDDVWHLTLSAYSKEDTPVLILQGRRRVDMKNGAPASSEPITFTLSTEGIQTAGSVSIFGTFTDTAKNATKYKATLYDLNTNEVITDMDR